ncbi:MAG: methyltransferase domain-containing protein [Anaerolineaceae bacterium]|nr:methyltransferase domain-containing protein [Anaerolineaceae bacterium]
MGNSEELAGWEPLFQNGFIPPRYQTLADPNDSVVEWADTLPSGASILDVGCGIGRHLIYLGGRGFKMAGMDISPSGVKTSQTVCAERNIDFDGRVSNMTALPWADMTFDAALSTSVISHNLRADIFKTLEEVRRVLKPGGLFLVDFPHKDTFSYQRVRKQAAAGEITEVEPDTFVDQSPEPDETDDAYLPHHFCDEADVRDLLRAFEIIRLWADLPEPSPQGNLPARGYWVAWTRKPLSG